MNKVFATLLVSLFSVSVFSQYLIPFRDGFKMGYCDRDMKVVIEPKYKLTFPFMGERAVVTVDNTFHLIDKKGNRVSDKNFAYGNSITDLPRRFGGIYLFSEGNGSYSVIDTNGNYVLERFRGTIQDFSEGFAAFTKSTGSNYNAYRYGVLNDKGQEIIPEKYLWVRNCSEGLFAVEYSSNIWGFVDKNDKVIIPFQYEQAFPFSQGLAAVKKGGKFGFIDKTGKEVIPCKYDKAYTPFKEGLTTVDLNGQTLLINKKGEVIKTMQKQSVGEFINGRALVNRYTTANYYGFIDRKGNEVVPVIYTNARKFTKAGLAAVQIQNKNQYVWGFIDTSGKVMTPFEYYSIGLAELRDDYYFDNGLCIVSLSVEGSGSEFFIDTKNQRHTTKLITTSDGGYITAERYNEILAEQKRQYEDWKRSQNSSGCQATCNTCGGSGAVKTTSSNFPCGVCGGRGVNGYSKSTLDSYTKVYTSYSPNVCWKCNGSGSGGSSSRLELCPTCHGTGCSKH